MFTHLYEYKQKYLRMSILEVAGAVEISNDHLRKS